MRRWGWILAVVLAACGRSAPAPLPAAAPVPEKVPSIDEVRAIRTAGDLDLYEHALKVLSASADTKTRGRAESLLGLFYLDQNRHEEAVPYLERAAADDPIVAPWMWLRIEDIASVDRVLQLAPESTAAPIARLRITALYAQAGNAEATNSALRDTKLVPIDETTEGDFVEMARTLSKGGLDDLATEVRMRLLTEYPQGRYTEENYGALAKLSPSPLDALNRDDTLDLARKLGNSEHFDQALDLLRRFAERMPAEAAVEEYRNLRLRSLFASRHYGELLAETSETTIRNPAMLLLRARAAWRDDKPQEFLAGLAHIEEDFPRSSEAVQAKILRAKYYTTDDPKLDIAIANLRDAIAAGGWGKDGENLWTLGWTYILANRYDEALRTFADYKAKFPDGDYLSNALFWTGKVDDKLGKAADRDAAWDELEATYPYNYFSYRARVLRNQPTVISSDIPNGNAFPDLDADLAQTKISDQTRLDLIAELTWLGLYRDAISNVKAMVEAYPQNAAVAMMLADTYVEAGEPLRANAVLQRRFRTFIRHGGSGIPRRFWQILYPLAYWDVIQREGAKQNVDPYLIASIARQESIFEPKTVSNAGAVGIMQIMPGEAARIAAAAGLQPPTREQLFDPEINIALGAAEYAQKRSAMNGNDILAIAAYNAGTEPVGKWLAQTPVDDGDSFVESIPFNETRLYVKTVLRNRFEYRRIYENGSSTPQQHQ